MSDGPAWICWECGKKISSIKGRGGRAVTMHIGKCDVCRRDGVSVCHARNYGYPKWPEGKEE